MTEWAEFATVLLEQAVAHATEDSDGHVVANTAASARECFVATLDGDGAFASVVASAELDEPSALVLAICAAVEVDRRLQRLVAALTHEPLATRPTVDVLTTLLGPDSSLMLADDAPLQRAALIDLEPDVAFASAEVAVPRRVLWTLLGDTALDPALPVGTELSILGPQYAAGTELVLVTGTDRIRRLQAAMLATAGIAFLITTPPGDEPGWQALVRQATVDGLGVILQLDDDVVPPLVARWVDRASHLRFALCSRDRLSLAALPRRAYTEIVAADASVDDDEWSSVFPDDKLPARVPTAEHLHWARRAAMSGLDATAAIRRAAEVGALRHARLVTPTLGWDALVLPEDRARQLHGLVDRYRLRAKVHGAWGLPLYPSPGMVALFAGASGTGKSTAAEVVASGIGLDVYRVDLSALVSKYIGETEKNLEQVFSAAHAGDFMLVFEEADALFGSRSNVSDARDRYANMEVSYLLQRLESHDGFVVLTSNFQGNIDAAFLRRMHAVVHFEMPGAADRRLIWDKCIAQAPRGDIDLDFVAEKFDLSGGSIRMAALGAAFFAASEDAPVEMVHILQAAAQEMTKLRRRPSDAQFGPWLPEVQRAMRGSSPAASAATP